MQVNCLVGPKEMANILKVPVSWIYQRTSEGHEAIPFIKMGKYVRFDPGEVIEFFKKQENGKS